jgi:hypothetical protein
MTEQEAPGVYHGFDGYRSATEADYQHVLTDGLVVPDTNVLLNLYRYNNQARTDLLTVLRRLGDHLWVPHQVLAEFWRNREGAVRSPEEAAQRATEELASQRAAAVQSLRTWANRVALEAGRVTDLQVALEAGFNTLDEAIADSVHLDEIEQALDTNADPILAMLHDALVGRVGGALEQSDRATLIAEGRRRAEAGIPPGYKDAQKSKRDDDEGPAGDFLVWEEVLREAERRHCDVLIVTGDVKEDWWRKKIGRASCRERV